MKGNRVDLMPFLKKERNEYDNRYRNEKDHIEDPKILCKPSVHVWWHIDPSFPSGRHK
jgi:hypothetical protein